MSLPADFLPLAFDATRGVPQVVPLAGQVPGLRIAIVAGAMDLARLMSAPPDQVVHDARLVTTNPAVTDPVATTTATGSVPAHVGAHQSAVAAFTAGPPDSLATAAVPVWIVVSGASGVYGSWPALPGRPLAVSGDSRFLGDLWIDELRLAAGSLVRGGECGSRIGIGWRPAGGQLPTATGVPEEDPYVGLI